MPLRAGDVAWLAALPCALLVVAAIVLLGPSLGELIFPTPTVAFWSGAAPAPEPTEHARYLIALGAPILLTAVVALLSRRAWTASSRVVAALVVAAQLATVALLAVSIVVQHRYVIPSTGPVLYFTSTTLLVAAAIALVLVAAIASARFRRRLDALCRESRARWVAGSTLALLAVLVSTLPALNFEATIGNAHPAVVEHMSFWLDEAFAVLNGPFPLVGYAAQYGSLWPYLVGGAMAVVGASIGVFTVAMSTITAAAMLAVFAVLRRLARSTVAGLLLFLPFLATSFFVMEGPLDDRYSTVNLFSTFPLRYAAPFLLAWLVVRHLDGASPRAPRWLFLAAGLAVLNNSDFGVPALGATLAALLWAGGGRGLRRIALEAAVGLVAALALVSLLTLLTAGGLPHPGLLFRFTGMFALAGFGMLPMLPTIGLSTVLYLTYVAAIAVATVRRVEREPDRATTGLLAWSGVFGLGVGSYYVGRSHPEVLTNMFPAWALSVTLLSMVSVRAIAARASRRPTLAEVACLVAFGVMVCSLAQTPAPWSEAARLRHTGEKLYALPAGEPFIAAHTRPGETVAILTALGHRVAYDVHVADVAPYAAAEAMPLVEQLDETLDALEAAGGTRVFLNLREPEWPGIPEKVAASGYALTAQEPYGMAELTRMR